MSYVFGVVGSFSLLSLLSRNFRVSSRVGSLVGRGEFPTSNVSEVEGEPVPEMGDFPIVVKEDDSVFVVEIEIPLTGGSGSKKMEKANAVVSVDFDSLPEDKKLNIKVGVDPRALLKKGKTSKKNKKA